MGVAEFHQAGAFGVLGDAAFQGDGPHFVRRALAGRMMAYLEVAGCSRYLAVPDRAPQCAVPTEIQRQQLPEPLEEFRMGGT